MLVYRVYLDSNPEEPLGWAGDFASAKKVAHTFKHNTDLLVDLVEMFTDKSSLLEFLNTGRPVINYAIKRSWQITPRGGLQEIPPPGASPKEKADEQA